VRRDGTQVHDPDVTPWWFVEIRFICADRHEPCTLPRRDRDSRTWVPVS
jgi:hypothetical protein